jgi:hypothetical protein
MGGLNGLERYLPNTELGLLGRNIKVDQCFYAQGKKKPRV